MSMATKLGRMVTNLEWVLPINVTLLFGLVILRNHLTN